MARKKYEIDMCNGPLLGKILLFTLPLIAAGILQLMFNAADMIVAGRFAGSDSLGAVGATSSLINMIINIFIGLSVGANVAIANFEGAGRKQDVSDTVHTAIALSIVGGILMMAIGIMVASPMLNWMGTPPEVLPHAIKYMQIYFIGMPAMGLYNFGAAVLRAIGDTKRPLYYLTFAGVVNFLLNLVFVIKFGMGVAGVAWATDISQTISALLVVRCLMKEEGSIHLELSKLKIHTDKMIRIARVGLPAGLQGVIFSVSNVLIQSSVNSFGALAVAGNTACQSLEGFIYNSMNTFHQSAISFVGQNMGAKKYDRIKKTLYICLASVTVTGMLMGTVGCFFGRPLLSLYTDNPEVIEYGFVRMQVIFLSYFLCGIMDVIVGVLRGMGYSIMPMIVSLLGSCLFRIIWIFTVFKMIHTQFILYISYPISWALTFTVHVLCFVFIAWRKLNKTNA